ncbi:IucA/IucC family siderophore biosynthesis protein [Dankookia rubra]|uniref:IucA/IucC family siderophore biosynthesis protein n=1 Tax=Dankookia rubra TaxID=1442381 RepID=A0A4V3A9W3_9PROT|nr:IucA/IucC family protein [Dankookia rubra]TDH60815.1 IucA/IucC family siderophore biosynthesis protein [Dankookia rubra]
MSGIPDAATWRQAGRALLAKAISEFAYEEAVLPEVQLKPDGSFTACLRLASGVRYRFAGTRRIWGNLAIDPNSLRRMDGALETEATDPQQWVLDARAELGGDAVATAGFLRELGRTQHAEALRLARCSGLDAADWVALPPDRAQGLLSGHPKAVANKGRLGWGDAALAAFAPERAEPFQLVWVVLDARHATWAAVDNADFPSECIPPGERGAFDAAVARSGIAPEHALHVPVHPWQWDNVVLPEFSGEIAAGRIVPIDSFGDLYRPQQSIRTLTNVSRRGRADVKLALSILNTSAYRGLGGATIAAGQVLSGWLAGVIAADPVLRRRRVTVLRELAGAHYAHPAYAALPEAPYHFCEHLGAVLRESAEAHAASGETPALYATLHERDATGRPLALTMAKQAGLGIEAWLERLFDLTVVPLHHLLCRYGCCPIAHGQNIVLLLRHGLPVAMALKDFQGDFDLADTGQAEAAGLPGAVAALLPRKRAEVVVHNIQTAHFVTTLRFLSDGLAAAGTLPEMQFYRILARVLRAYQREAGLPPADYARYELFAPALPKVCINKVRLAVGYGDTASRPLPALGTPLLNPLHLAETGAPR